MLQPVFLAASNAICTGTSPGAVPCLRRQLVHFRRRTNVRSFAVRMTVDLAGHRHALRKVALRFGRAAIGDEQVSVYMERLFRRFAS
jgi:hypothetical protein